MFVCVCVFGNEGRGDLGASLLADLRGQRLQGNRHHRRVFSGEFCAYCCTFECQACVHMGVWNEGELTDGGRRVVSGQYHHGPTSPNIIWVLNSGVSGLHTVHAGRKHNKTESERGGEKQMVFMRKRRI